MYDSWRSTDPAGPAAGPGTVASMPPTGQHPQLISSAWRIRNLSEIQTTADGSSAILGPEVAVAQDNSTNDGQENDKMAPVANSELVNGEEDCEKMLNSSFSASFPSPSPSSLPQPCDQNRQDFFPQSIRSMASTPAARSSQLLDSISDLRLVDETEAAVRQRRPSDGALPVSTGSCGISYTNGHVVTGSEVSVSDEKAGYMNLRHKSRRKPVQDRPRPKRQAARDMCRPLKQWLYCHRDTPYPTKAEKQDLALLSRMTLTQVSNWFANARRRLKNTVSGGQEVTWRRRIKLYNQFVVGNQELLSISSDDTMWDEEDDDDDEEEEEERREWEEGRMEGREKDSVLNDSLPLYPSPPRLTTATSSSLLSSSLDASGRRHRLPLLTFDPEVVDLSSPATASPSGACCTPAAKFKQGILQRYLTDAYERVGQNGVKEGEGDEEEGDGGAMEEAEASRRRHGRRHRNGSGSLSSHDYEEEMSLSARSTPTKEHQTNEEDDIAEDRGHSNTPSKFGASNDPDDLYWMEISAALALTNLAMRSRLNSGSSHESSPRV